MAADADAGLQGVRREAFAARRRACRELLEARWRARVRGAGPGGRLGDGCLDALPTIIGSAPRAEAVRLIDVLWLDRRSGAVAGAFEVEHTTSIYSGIVRLLDLALGVSAGAAHGLFLVAPDSREEEVCAQLARPAFSRVANLGVRFLPYGELERNRGAMARFGQGMRPIEAVAKALR